MKKYVFALLVMLSGALNGQIYSTQYTTANSGLPDNTVYAIASNPADSLATDDIWVATQNGLAHKQFDNWAVYNTSNSALPDNSIRSVYLTPNGTVYAGTFTGGFARFDGSTFTVFNTTNSNLPDNFVKGFAYQAPNTIWIATTGGLAKLEGDNITAFDLSQLGLESNHITSVVVKRNGQKVIGLVNGGFAYYNDTTFTFYTHTNSGLPDNTIASIALDADDNPFLAMPSGGIVAHYGGNIFQVYNQALFPNMSNSYRCIVADAFGLWAGSVDKGVFRKPGNGSFNSQNTLGIVGIQPDTTLISAHVPPVSFKNNITMLYLGSDAEGLYRLSSLVGIGETPIDKSAQLTINQNTLNANASSPLLSISLYNATGQLLATAQPQGNTYTLPLPRYSGLVIVHCTTANGVLVKKFMVE